MRIQSRHKAMFVTACLAGFMVMGFQNCAHSGGSGDSGSNSILANHMLQGSCDESASQGICAEDYQDHPADVNADKASCGAGWSAGACPQAGALHSCVMAGDQDATDEGEAIGPFKTYYYANSTLSMVQMKADCTDGSGQWQ